jgi:hypothetical protein
MITYAVVLLWVIGYVVDCLREYLQLMASVAFRTPTYLSVQYQISFCNLSVETYCWANRQLYAVSHHLTDYIAVPPLHIPHDNPFESL